jgi:hypothetical protein
MIYLKYLCYLLRHKWFVFLECLKLGVPLWAAIVHDWQKFTPAEFGAYAINFFGPYDKDNRLQWLIDAFERAWLHHLHYGPHHWDYWLIRDDSQPWAIQEHSMGNPPILAKDGKPLLWVEYDGEDDALHTTANQILHDVVDRLNRGYKALEMPDRYRREMLADWRGAGRAISGKDDAVTWYIKKRDEIILHSKTREWIEHQLGIAFAVDKG